MERTREECNGSCRWIGDDDESEDGEDSSVNESSAKSPEDTALDEVPWHLDTRCSSLLEHSHDGIPCNKGCRPLSLLGLRPGLGHAVCTPCRNDNESVVQDAIRVLTEVALAPLLNQVDSIEERDARVFSEDSMDGPYHALQGMRGRPASCHRPNQPSTDRNPQQGSNQWLL